MARRGPAENPWLLRAVLEGFSVNDITHTLHCLPKILDNMQEVDERQGGGDEVFQDH
jgi:hypothetical protein